MHDKNGRYEQVCAKSDNSGHSPFWSGSLSPPLQNKECHFYSKASETQNVSLGLLHFKIRVSVLGICEEDPQRFSPQSILFGFSFLVCKPMAQISKIDVFV